MRDIYNPPPAPLAFDPPQPEPLVVTGIDVAYLVAMCVVFGILAAWPWAVDMVLGLGVTIGGLFIILESWFSGLTFLKRHPAARPVGRYLVFLVALTPWLFGLGVVTAVMLGLFWVSDHFLL